jgi:hypothetical protein
LKPELHAPVRRVRSAAARLPSARSTGRSLFAVVIVGGIIAFLVSTGRWPEVEQAVGEAFGVEPTTSDATLELLDTITVKGKAPMTGYEREEVFGPAWKDTDRNGCDQRNDVLTRDLMAKSYKPGTHDCVVLTGTLEDPYTGQTIPFQRGQDTSAEIQIDHRVPLGYAWRQGAQQWRQEQRVAFANDFDNLIAVDGPANGQKSDSGPSAWLPPNKGYRCEYVAEFVEVAAEYDLSMPQADVDAARRVLLGC